MKTFGEIQEGDFVYSLNQKKFGVLTKIAIKSVKHDSFWTIINIGDYYGENQYYNDNTDLIIKRPNKSSIADIAPSLEGVKEYWRREIENDIDIAKEQIQSLEKHIISRQNDMEIINNITEN